MSIFEGDNPLEGSAILLLLLQLIIVVVLSRILTKLLRYIKQPPVIAEIVGGIILGPTVMGYVPGFTDNIFPEHSMEVFYTFAEVGLIFFMFLIGMEVDPQLFRRKLGPSLVISLTAMGFTFALSLGASAYIYYQVPSGASYLEAILFTGVATAITAFPVLARILADQNLMQSKVGVTALSVAAIDDVTGWIALALVVSIAKSSGSLTALYTLLALLGYVLVMLVVVRPVTALLVRTSHRKKMQHEALVLVLMLLFASAWTTEAIGIHAIFGGFVMGIVVPRENQFHMKVTKAIEDLVTIVFLPLYFTYSGLRTKLEDLNTTQSGIMVILILAASNIGKIGGATFAARLVGHTCRESLTVGVLLNTKGLVELIVLNIGLDVGILTEEMFASFIVMALFNTFITTPLTYLLWTRWAVRNDPNLRPKDKFSVVMCVDEPASALAMVEVAAAVIHGQKRRKKLRRRPTINALQLMEVSDAPSSYFFALRQKKSNALVFAKKHATLLGLNLRSTMRVSAHVTHDLTDMLNSWLHELVLLCWHPPHPGAELTQGRGILHQLLQHARAPIGALVYPGNFNAMNSVDNVLFVYRLERYEREAFQLVLSLLNNPQTKVTIVMPSRQSWERELMRQYHQDEDDDEFFDDYEDDTTEMDELMELAVSDDDVDVDDEGVKATLDDEADNLKNEDDDDEQVAQTGDERSENGSTNETKKKKKRKTKKDKCCPYSVGDFFDILFLLGLLKRGLVGLMHALLDTCCGGSQRRQRESLGDESSPSSSAEDIGMKAMASSSTARKDRRASSAAKRSDRPTAESDSDSEMTPAATGSGLTTSRSLQGISRMAERLEEEEEEQKRSRAKAEQSKSDHEGMMHLHHKRRRRKRARAKSHHLPWIVGKRRHEKRKLELEEDPERAWMSDMDDVLAQLNKHPDQVTIVQVNMHRLLEATLKEEKKKRAKHQRQLLLVGIDREWDAFARDQARWSAFVHTAATPSTFVLFLHPRLPHSPTDSAAAASSPSADGGGLRDRLLCCCCRPARGRHQSATQPSAAIDDERSRNEDDNDNDEPSQDDTTAGSSSDAEGNRQSKRNPVVT